MTTRFLTKTDYMDSGMNQSLFFTISAALTVCLLAAAGCTGTAGTAAQPPVHASPVYPVVSFNATPIQHAQVNGVMLAYREFGAGEPVLMITGFGNTMDDWNQTFIGIIATKYHVYIYDHRGMGASSDNNATPTISRYSDDAAGLMTALGYDSMHVYGVSMGSSVSQQLVIDHPERVRKLILDSSSYSVRVPETKKLLGSIEAAAASPAIPEGIRKEAQANLAWNGSYEGLSGISKDVMLVVGTNDELTPDPVSERMAGQINGSWLVRFKDLPHVGSRYAPVEYGENALYFLGMDESPLER
jgi:pimeloyl-ACP methyl ester carboxylesterase